MGTSGDPGSKNDGGYVVDWPRPSWTGVASDPGATDDLYKLKYRRFRFSRTRTADGRVWNPELRWSMALCHVVVDVWSMTCVWGGGWHQPYETDNHRLGVNPLKYQEVLTYWIGGVVFCRSPNIMLRKSQLLCQHGVHGLLCCVEHNVRNTLGLRYGSCLFRILILTQPHHTNLALQQCNISCCQFC